MPLSLPFFAAWLAATAASVVLAIRQLVAPAERLMRLQCQASLVVALLSLLTLGFVGFAEFGIAAPFPFSAQRLDWLLAAFILVLSAVIHRFSLRFLLGDRDQPRALAWLTLLATGTSMAWLSNDTRGLAAGWGLALFSLVRLIGLADDWPAARAAGRLVGMRLALAWAALAVLVLLAHGQSGTWELNPEGVTAWPVWARHAAAGCLLLAALIPAAQWPFQRWLMATLVAPTPVSAVMHAGIVNAGAILLLKFGGVLAAAEWAGVVLMLIAVLSIVLGGGMMRVQADVKRQLAASTVAQMGCMLLQCALGAYGAALTHLMLHGFFKAGLFLQAGGTVSAERKPYVAASYARVFGLAALLAGALLLWNEGWRAAPAGWLSALLLAWFGAQGLAALPVWRWSHLPYWALSLGGFVAAQTALHALLPAGSEAGGAPATGWVLAAAALLLGGAGVVHRMQARPDSPAARRLYWLFVGLSEAPSRTLDPHPAHLSHRIRPGVFA